MKNKVFTLVFAFLAMAGNAIWGQSSPTEINVSFMYGEDSEVPTGTGFTASKGTETTGDNAYSNTLEITSGGYYKLTGTESNIQITISATDPVYITLASGLHVDASLDNTVDTPSQSEGDGHIGSGVWSDRCAMQINKGAYVTLDWEGDVELSSGGDRAGINVKPGATLVLKGPSQSTLYGTCWNNQNGIYTTGAGIGGDSEDADFGTIIIESGKVVGRCYAQVSNWRAYGAGIGGGFEKTGDNPVTGTGSKDGTIIIKEGDVTGTTNYPGGSGVTATTGRSAAIGGGYAGTCTNIAILGGTINNNTATGNDADVIGVGEDYEGGIVVLIFTNQDGSEYARLEASIPEVKKGESTYIDAGTTSDITNAYDFRIEKATAENTGLNADGSLAEGQENTEQDTVETPAETGNEGTTPATE